MMLHALTNTARKTGTLSVTAKERIRHACARSQEGKTVPCFSRSDRLDANFALAHTLLTARTLSVSLYLSVSASVSRSMHGTRRVSLIQRASRAIPSREVEYRVLPSLRIASITTASWCVVGASRQ